VRDAGQAAVSSCASSASSSAASFLSALPIRLLTDRCRATIVHSLRTANPPRSRRAPSIDQLRRSQARSHSDAAPSHREVDGRARPDTGPDADDRSVPLAWLDAELQANAAMGAASSDAPKRPREGAGGAQTGAVPPERRDCLDTGCCAPPTGAGDLVAVGERVPAVSSPPSTGPNCRRMPRPAPNSGARSAPPFDIPPPAPRREGSQASGGGVRMPIAVRASTRRRQSPGLGGAGVRGRLQARFRRRRIRGLDGSYARAVRANRETGGATRSRTGLARPPDAARALGGLRAELGAESLAGRTSNPRHCMGRVPGSNEKLDRTRGEVSGTEPVTEAVAPFQENRARERRRKKPPGRPAPPRCPRRRGTAARTASSSPARAGSSGRSSAICAGGPVEHRPRARRGPAAGCLPRQGDAIAAHGPRRPVAARTRAHRPLDGSLEGPARALALRAAFSAGASVGARQAQPHPQLAAGDHLRCGGDGCECAQRGCLQVDLQPRGRCRGGRRRAPPESRPRRHQDGHRRFPSGARTGPWVAPATRTESNERRFDRSRSCVPSGGPAGRRRPSPSSSREGDGDRPRRASRRQRYLARRRRPAAWRRSPVLAAARIDRGATLYCPRGRGRVAASN